MKSSGFEGEAGCSGEGIFLEGHTDLHVIARSTLTAVMYQDEILRATVSPYAGAVGSGVPPGAGQCPASCGSV